LEKALTGDYSLILLDVMLPGINGFDICLEIRKKKKHIPILMITSRSEENDKVTGFENGADDYIVKPFSIRELVARVKAILRRTKGANAELAESDKKLIFEGITIDLENRIVLLGKKNIELSPKEFDLLYLLAKHPGRSYSRQQLLDTIWGYQFEGFEHTVNSHINRLRSKIEKDMTDPKFILTTWGIGYRFNREI
jgi:two-component system alkaline phosphatase synthesis response regulator PhoP